MLKLIAFLALFIFSAQSVFSEEKTDKNGYRVLDVNQFKDLDVKSKKNSPSVSVTSSCKANNGNEYTVGSIGYESCIRETQMEHVTGKKDSASPTTTFTITK